MNKKESENKLAKIFNNKQVAIDFLSIALKKTIKDVRIIGVEYFKGIVEYEFSLLKVNVIYDTKEIEELYLKIIRGGRIKESIFCFWSLLYEEYIANNKEQNKSNVLLKTTITQRTVEDYNRKMVLILNQKLDYCAIINLIEFKNFANHNKNYKERWGNNLDIECEDILFIGTKKILK